LGARFLPDEKIGKRIGKRLLTVACVTVGLCLGFVVGYAVFLANSAATNPFFIGERVSGDAFNRLFAGMARLGAAEMLAANCTGSSDTQFALSKEAEIIPALSESAKAVRLTPQLSVAEARLAVRFAIAAHQRTDDKQKEESEDRARRLLDSAGWKTPIATLLREIKDRNGCGK
jgi:hypothetical protein